MTRVETLIFSKYLVGSRANPWHGHVVGKSLVWGVSGCVWEVSEGVWVVSVGCLEVSRGLGDVSVMSGWCMVIV